MPRDRVAEVGAYLPTPPPCLGVRAGPSVLPPHRTATFLRDYGTYGWGSYGTSLWDQQQKRGALCFFFLFFFFFRVLGLGPRVVGFQGLDFLRADGGGAAPDPALGGGVTLRDTATEEQGLQGEKAICTCVQARCFFHARHTGGPAGVTWLLMRFRWTRCQTTR